MSQETEQEKKQVPVKEVFDILVPVSINLVHEDCGGVFRSTGIAFLGNPAGYEYACDKCGEKITSERQYPRIDHVRQEDIKPADEVTQEAPEVEVVE